MIEEAAPSELPGRSAAVWRNVPPDVGRPLLDRGRLLAALGRRFESRLITIVAGPGFGKTALLAQAVAENRRDPCGEDVWSSCVPADALVSSLAGSLLTGLGRSGPVPTDPLTAADHVAAAVSGRSPTAVCIVVDDVHVVPAGSPGAELLSALTDRLPLNGHLVLAGRTMPLPARMTLRAAASLSADDLAFDARELAAFAAIRGVPRELLESMGRWPALAELAGAAGTGGVVDYLWSEILQGLTAIERALLAALTVTGGADAELLSELAKADIDADELLARIPLTSRRADGWYVLHPLWDSVLKNELTTMDVAAARRRAAFALQRKGSADALDAAVRLFAAADSWNDILGLVRQTVAGTHPVVGPDVLAAWLSGLPADVQRGPDGLLLRGLVAKREDLPAAAGFFERAADLFRSVGAADGEAAALIHLMHVCWWQLDVPRLSAAAARASQLGPLLIGELAELATFGRILVFDLTDAPGEALALLRSMPPAMGDMAPGVDYLRALTLLELGEADQASPYAQRCLQHATGPFHSTGLSIAMLTAWFCGRILDALGDVPQLAESAEVPGRQHNVIVERAVCAVLTAMVGDSESAELHLRVARAARTATSADASADTAVALAQAALLVTRADESAAAVTLDAHLARHALADAGIARIHRFALSLTYVLVPETRTYWDNALLGPCFAEGRMLARAVVHLRGGGALDELDRLRLPSAGVIRALLPVAWSTELAVALLAANRPEGVELLTALTAAARPFVKAIPQSAPRFAAAARAALTVVSPTPTARIRLLVLGSLELLRDGSAVVHPDLRRDRVRQLLLYLIAHGTATRAQVADALWPDMDADSANRNLRVNLAYLQRVLEPDRLDEPFFIRTDGARLRMVSDGWLDLDSRDFDRMHGEAKAADVAGDPPSAQDLYVAAAALYRGDYMSDIPDADWVNMDRDRYRAAFVHATVRGGELSLARGTIDASQTLARRALRVDPWSEPAHRLLAAAYLSSGDRVGAERVLHQCRNRLRELGVPPESATNMLLRQLRQSAAQ